MFLRRVQLHESVTIDGINGERLHVTGDDAQLFIDEGLLHIVPRGQKSETLVPIENVRWMWTAVHEPQAINPAVKKKPK